MKNIRRTAWLCGVLAISASQCIGQNTLQFTSVNLTPENAIQLHWASNTNEVYEIDEADALAGNPDGSTAWNILYDDYPSHGTNTFIGDFGNYDLAPAIPHPKYEQMRFYRVLMTETNDGANPSITIVSPTNGFTASSNLTVTVTASSSQVLTETKLFVDGQEMPPSSDGTNFIINTCEWWNGQHTLFAVAKSQSGMEGSPHDFSITYGRAVSSYVNVAFTNLITKVAFSQPFFQPSLGQTQEVTASFAANVNWTLQVINESSNAVRTVTGSGTSLLFDWDGTGDSGTNIPDGVYYYSIAAQTNGQAFSPMMSMASSRLGSATSLSSVVEDEPEQLWAVAPDGSAPFPFAILPPGIGTNGYTIFEASQTEMQALTAAARPVNGTTRVMRVGTFTANDNSSGGGASPDAAGAPASQNTVAPVRPPTSPVKNAVGTFGVCYQQYLNTSIRAQEPTTGWSPPLPVYVAVDGSSASGSVHLGFEKLLESKRIAGGFKRIMTQEAWNAGFIKPDDEVTTTDLEKSSLGGNSIFNNVNLGLLVLHGSFATTPEDDNVKYTYLWVENLQAANAQYLRLSDFDFGGSDPTNGLRWMTILACDTLTNSCYNSMHNNFKLPINNNLHILLGGSTIVYMAPDLGENYAANLTQKKESVINSWYDAGRFTYSYQYGTNMTDKIVKFAYSSWPSCINDTLYSYSNPDQTDVQYNQTQVWP